LRNVHFGVWVHPDGDTAEGKLRTNKLIRIDPQYFESLIRIKTKQSFKYNQNRKQYQQKRTNKANDVFYYYNVDKLVSANAVVFDYFCQDPEERWSTYFGSFAGSLKNWDKLVEIAKEIQRRLNLDKSINDLFDRKEILMKYFRTYDA